MQDEFSDSIFKYFATLIEKETGIQFDEANKYLLLSRLENLVKFLNFPDVLSLWNDIQKNGLNQAAKLLLLDSATNNETSFFRDPKVFDFFKNHFVTNIMAQNPKIRIWCAATSTGQEPYTIAMIMAELKAQGIAKSYEIFGTDISDRVLKQAASGTYSQLEIQRGLPANLMIKYFEQISVESSNFPSFKAKPELSAFMTFKQMNLLHEWPDFGTFDIIFCRNVLIYQSKENKKNIISRFTKVLNPGGYLVLGGAESLLQLSDDFDFETYGNICVHKLKASVKPYT
ncbi:CheR family methyltransferase [Fluviispira vulneris]|uniref:CheR family methyltransferase n=1 Tax=Fluviispira vulneris TaxID=2763012 RepID=UPI0016488800|nr:CheR family methyltransferase [Fluviispira vulneris]